ncbi:MAG: diacylglycerol kinase family lipid kinase [Ferroplasma sp.]|uniref:diacylglycerol/lipid kinase family protein n=1 Tax=Ferroplasma sp. TaxID=2591003 RepID=UPI002815121E|nr:diacylglycerol kinase family lipid kinase [Ferroplasma sp.]WMT50512.1 MAG: diacylglycerol kinase family lipid kinase [Ferroplasma sp.]
MKIYVILNPHAGNGRGVYLLDRLKRFLKDYDYIIRETKRNNDAFLYAQEALKGNYDYIVCVGGDGTINEICQAIVCKSTVLIIIDAGTGSDFVKSAGSISPEDIGNAITSNKIFKVDSVLVKYSGKTRYFVNIMELGYGANVIARVNKKLKRNKNTIRHAVINELFKLRAYNLKITIKNEVIEGKFIDVIIANGKYFGGGMLASKNSVLNDHVMEVHMIKEISRMTLLMKFKKLINGTYIEDRDTINKIAQQIEISGDKAPVEMDGEVLFTTPISIELIPESINILLAS